MVNKNNHNHQSPFPSSNQNYNKRQKTATIDEEDVCTILQRYTGTQVLALLKEVAAAATPGAKIDWEVVASNIQNSNSSNVNSNNNTAFGSARECQMLWRHLAYRHPLFDHPPDDSSPPLDDDSDLEIELEASPPFSTEIATEAANCVKRWTNIKKKQTNAGGVSATGPRLSDLHLTNQALDIALKDNVASGRSTGGNGAKTNGDASATNATGKPGTAGVPKSRPPPKKAPPKPTITDPVTATAVAAGARILPQSEAHLLKAAQTKNTAHVRVGSSLGKPSATVNGSLPPNVHYICTGLLPTSTAAATLPRTGSQTKSNTVKVNVPSTSVSHLSKAKTTPVLLRKSTVALSTTSNEQPSKVTSSTEVKVPVSDSKTLVQVKQDAVASRSSLKAPPEIGLPKTSSDVDPGNLAAANADNSDCEIRNGAIENRCEGPDHGIAMENPILKADNEDQTPIQETGAPSVNGTHEHVRSQETGAPSVNGTHEHVRRLVTGDDSKTDNSNEKMAGTS